MKLKEQLAYEHAESEGDNGYAEISFLAGFDAAIALILEKVSLDRTQQELVYTVGDKEVKGSSDPQKTPSKHEFNGS